MEFDEIMAGWEDPRSEKDNLDLMVESVFCLFRSFDKEDLGKISKEEFFDVRLFLYRLAIEDYRYYIQQGRRGETIPSF